MNSVFFQTLLCFQERDYNTLLPDYEEAIAQSMKQPPPPYCQVAMTTSNPMASNATENQATIILPSGIQVIPSTCEDVRNKIPPAYEENTNTTSSLETRSIPSASDHANNEAASSSSLSVAAAAAAPSSSSAANDSNVSAAEQRQPNH